MNDTFLGNILKNFEMCKEIPQIEIGLQTGTRSEIVGAEGICGCDNGDCNCDSMGPIDCED